MTRFTRLHALSILVAIIAGILVTTSALKLQHYCQTQSCTTVDGNSLQSLIGITFGMMALYIAWHTFDMAEKQDDEPF